MKKIRSEQLHYHDYLKYQNGLWEKLKPPFTSDPEWIQNNDKTDYKPQSIETKTFTILTFNVLFDLPLRSVSDPTFHAEKRFQYTIEKINQFRPDIVNLQEVTTTFKKLLLKNEQIQNHYFISDVDCEPYSQLTLSKFPFQRLRTYSFGEKSIKKVLLADFCLSNQLCLISNVHLPAGHGGKDSELDRKQREGQLKRIIQLFEKKDYPLQIMTGDFNFEEDSDENEHLSSFTDCWKYLRPKDKGYTEDNAKNSLAEALNPGEKPCRLDRVLLKSKDWKPTKIEMVMTQGFKSEDNIHERYFPSDHFGILTTFSNENKNS